VGDFGFIGLCPFEASIGGSSI